MWRFVCRKCEKYLDVEKYYPFCPLCGGALEVEGRLPKIRNVLGEGNTPVVHENYRGYEILFKLDYLNPSGSFKDRGCSCALYMAKVLGYKCSVVDSSGNTGLSSALYSSRLGIKSYVAVPVYASESKKKLIEKVGGELIEAPTREEAYEKAVYLSNKCYYVAHQTNPFFLHGMKTIGHELAKHVEGKDIILPVSSGSLLIGLYRGLMEAGAEDFRLIAVQAVETSSLNTRVKIYGSIGGDKSKYADALLVKNPKRLDEMVAVINGSGGGVVFVGDDAILEAVNELHRKGFIVEPSSSVVWAAFKHLISLGEARDSILILTGSGLKYI